MPSNTEPEHLASRGHLTGILDTVLNEDTVTPIRDAPDDLNFAGRRRRLWSRLLRGSLLRGILLRTVLLRAILLRAVLLRAILLRVILLRVILLRAILLRGMGLRGIVLTPSSCLDVPWMPPFPWDGTKDMLLVAPSYSFPRFAIRMT